MYRFRRNTLDRMRVLVAGTFINGRPLATYGNDLVVPNLEDGNDPNDHFTSTTYRGLPAMWCGKVSGAHNENQVEFHQDRLPIAFKDVMADKDFGFAYILRGKKLAASSNTSLSSYPFAINNSGESAFTYRNINQVTGSQQRHHNGSGQYISATLLAASTEPDTAFHCWGARFQLNDGDIFEDGDIKTSTTSLGARGQVTADDIELHVGGERNGVASNAPFVITDWFVLGGENFTQEQALEANRFLTYWGNNAEVYQDYSVPPIFIIETAGDTITGNISGQLDLPVASMTGDVFAQGNITGQLANPIAIAMNGVVIDSVGDITATIDNPVASLSGSVTWPDITGDITATIALPVATMSGTVGDVSTGDITGSIDLPVAALTGSVAWATITGDITATIALPVATLAGDVQVHGDITATIALPVAAILGAGVEFPKPAHKITLTARHTITTTISSRHKIKLEV